ncbi:cytochrome P450 2U1-like [Biomphalaria glabrata]|uniref:Cytochrome P450 2U1-like n=1 Tax=Biomphalaria glabrata TaxID=6526 RepID=A0A9W2YMM2_BIOGL|nr:cytochrome P450 2U1-like [Biomphalaria glabrata]XP_055863881.1 cytochrome P450 2U1-like [Biomphalaria glabrata]XP_055863882.1 cytochrome P450 2U1-like [Biomphalaria glabrata]
MIYTVLSYVSDTTCLAFIIIILIALYFRSRQPTNLPPSPGAALPIIGHLYMLEKNPRKQFKQWSEKYGDVFTLQMGPQRTIFVNTYEAMKEAFIKKGDYFSDRQNDNFLAKHIPQFTNGVILASGADWKAQRTTSLAILRNFGMGKNILAEKITEEISYFIRELAKANGKPRDIRYLTNMSVSNVICSIIFGKRFHYDDPKFQKQIELFTEVVKTNTGVLLLNFFPSLYYLPFDLFKGRQLMKLYSEVLSHTSHMVEEIQKSYDPENLDNYIFAYIDAMKKEKLSGESCYLSEVNLERNIDSLFIAGSETTSTSILWCLLYMLNYPETQKNMYDELLEHVGTERTPQLADKSKLTYLTAFIMEVQRKSSIAPISFPHLCTENVTLAGYAIPKGTLVMPNIDAVHGSKEIWGDPDNFRPQRFLDEQKRIIKREEFIPFFIGRRICLGESLATMELFLFLSTLIQKFEFLPASSDKVPPLSDTWGLVCAPEPYEIRCVERTK